MTLVLLLVLTLAAQQLCIGGKKPPPIDYDALERAWEAGDAREELQSAGDAHFQALASKSDEEAKALGPQMVFVTLRDGRSEPLAATASRWKEALWNGGVEVTLYELEADRKLLVGLQRGVQAPDLRRFLREQPEVVEVEWGGASEKPHHQPQQQPPARRQSTAKTKSHTSRVEQGAKPKKKRKRQQKQKATKTKKRDEL